MSRPFGSSFIARKLAPGGSAVHQETAPLQANQARSATFSKQPSPFTSTQAAAVTITDDDLIDMFDAIESQQAVAVNIAPLMQQSSTSVTKTHIPARANPLLAASTVPFSSKRKLDVNSAASVSHTISQPAALPNPSIAAHSSAPHVPSQPAVVASSHPEVSQALTPTCPTTVPISQPTAPVSAPLSPRPSQTLGQALIRSPVMRHLPPTGNQFKATANSNSSFAQNVFGGLAAASPRPNVASNAATPSGLQTPTDYGDVRSLQQGMTELKRQLAISERARTTKEGEMALLKQRHDQAERELQSLRVTFAKSHTVQSSQKAAEEVTAQRHQAELQSLRTSRQQLETELADRDRAMRSLTEERAANQRRLTQLEQRVQQLLKQHPTSLPSPKAEVVVERVEQDNKRKSMDAPVVMKHLPEPKRPRFDLKSRHSAISDEWSTVNIDLLIGSVSSGEPTGLFCLIQMLHQHELQNQNRTLANSLTGESAPVLSEPLQMCISLIRRRLLEPLEIAPLLLQCLQIQDFSIIKVAFECLRLIFEYTSNLSGSDASANVDGSVAAKCPLPQSNQELTSHPDFPNHRRMMCIATEAVRSPKSKSKPVSSSSSNGTTSNLMHKGQDKGSSADKKSIVVLSAPISRSASVEHRKVDSENFILNAVVSWFDKHLPRLEVTSDTTLLSESPPQVKLIFDRNTFSTADVDVVACGLEVLLALLPKLCNSESIWRRQLVARTALWVVQCTKPTTTSADMTVVCDSMMLSAQNVGNVLRLSPMHVRLVERIVSLSTLERGISGVSPSDHIMSELVAACLAVSSAASVDACKRLFALLEQQRAKPNELDRSGHDNDSSKGQSDVSALADSMSEFSIAERVHRCLLNACVQWTDRVLFVSNGRTQHSTTANRLLPPALIAAFGESLCEQTDTLVFAHQSASLMSPPSNLAHSLVRSALDCVVHLLHCLLRLVLSSADPNTTEISASLWSLRPMRHALLSVCTRLVHANVHPALRRLATEAHTLRQTLVQCGVFDAMNRDMSGELPMHSLAAAAMEPITEDPFEHDSISPLKPAVPQLLSPQPQTKDDKRTPRKTPLPPKK